MILQQLLLQLILILLNAFFAATEIALLSVNEKKVRAMADEGDKKAKKLIKIIDDPTKFLSAIQVGITLAGFLGSAFAADNFADKLTGAIVSTFGVADAYIATIDTVSVILITLILSYFTLVLGELVPKRVAMKHKEKLANGVCGVISTLTSVLKPIIWFLTASTNLVLRLFGIDPHEKDEAVSEEEIVVMLDAGADEGTLKQDDVEYIKNVFKLERLSAADVMTPRSAVVAVPDDIAEKDLLAVIEEEGYSRIPVYGDDLDDVRGILYVKDLLPYIAEATTFEWQRLLRKPYFVPEHMMIDDLLKEFQKNKIHIAIVVNEYGATQGLISLEDILEEVVGEITDESDEDENELYEKIGERSYIFDAKIHIGEFLRVIGFDEDSFQDVEGHAETLAGLMMELKRDLPRRGDELESHGVKFFIATMDGRRVDKIKVEVND